MCELYLSSSATPHFPGDDLRTLERHGGIPWTNQEGWGMAWLDEQDERKQYEIVKLDQLAHGNPLYETQLDAAHDAPVWLLHLRAASSGGRSMENTQPYHICWPLPNAAAGIFMHNGELKGMETRLLQEFGHDPRKGTADSEGGAHILQRDLEAAKDIEAAWPIFQDWAQRMRYMGIGNFIVGLERNVFVHVHRRTQVGEEIADDPGLFMAQSEDRIRLSSEPMADDDTALERGALLWIRDGKIVARGLTKAA